MLKNVKCKAALHTVLLLGGVLLPFLWAHAGDTVGVVKTRDYIVEIFNSSEGRSFTVKSADGQVLSEKLTENEFNSKYPDLRRFVEHSKSGPDNE